MKTSAPHRPCCLTWMTNVKAHKDKAQPLADTPLRRSKKISRGGAVHRLQRHTGRLAACGFKSLDKLCDQWSMSSKLWQRCGFELSLASTLRTQSLHANCGNQITDFKFNKLCLSPRADGAQRSLSFFIDVHVLHYYLLHFPYSFARTTLICIAIPLLLRTQSRSPRAAAAAVHHRHRHHGLLRALVRAQYRNKRRLYITTLARLRQNNQCL